MGALPSLFLQKPRDKGVAAGAGAGAGASASASAASADHSEFAGFTHVELPEGFAPETHFAKAVRVRGGNANFDLNWPSHTDRLMRDITLTLVLERLSGSKGKPVILLRAIHFPDGLDGCDIPDGPATLELKGFGMEQRAIRAMAARVVSIAHPAPGAAPSEDLHLKFKAVLIVDAATPSKHDCELYAHVVNAKGVPETWFSVHVASPVAEPVLVSKEPQLRWRAANLFTFSVNRVAHPDSTHLAGVFGSTGEDTPRNLAFNLQQPLFDRPSPWSNAVLLDHMGGRSAFLAAVDTKHAGSLIQWLRRAFDSELMWHALFPVSDIWRWRNTSAVEIGACSAGRVCTHDYNALRFILLQVVQAIHTDLVAGIIHDILRRSVSDKFPRGVDSVMLNEPPSEHCSSYLFAAIGARNLVAMKTLMALHIDTAILNKSGQPAFRVLFAGAFSPLEREMVAEFLHQDSATNDAALFMADDTEFMRASATQLMECALFPASDAVNSAAKAWDVKRERARKQAARTVKPGPVVAGAGVGAGAP
jgi:hypothetical protein